MIGDEPLSFETLGDLGDAFSLSDIPCKVDVMDWAYVDEQFRSLIAANQKKPAVSATAAARAMRRSSQ